MQRVNYDIIISVIFIILSIITIWQTKGLSELSYIFPRTIAILFLAFSVIYFVISIIKRENKKLFVNVDKKKALVMGLGMIGYGILISIIGFLIASIIYIGLVAWYFQKDLTWKSNQKKIFHASICSILVSGFFFYFFQHVFLVPLPSGIFG